MTITQFQTELKLLCSRLQDIKSQAGTLTDISKLYLIKLNEWPNPVNIRFLQLVVDGGFVKTIAGIDVAKDGRELILFCRHYAILESEHQKAVINETDDRIDELIVASLVGFWRSEITQHGEEEAVRRMKLAFPAPYGQHYQNELNRAYQIAAHGH